MANEKLALLSKKELDDRILSTMAGGDVEEHLALVAERSRRGGFDIDQTLECVLEAAQRKTYIAFVDVPDQLGRSWSERRYMVPGHLQDLILHCRIKGLPLLSSLIVEKSNIESGVMGESALSGFTLGAREAEYVFNDPVEFLREQQKLAFAYAKSSRRVQRSYLITWKESGWPIAELEALLARFAVDPTVIQPWRMQSHRQCAIGDKVYALKQGDGPKVIFGVGEIVGETFERNWDGQSHWMAPVRFEALVNPLQDALIDEANVKAVLPTQLIRHQASGVGIPRSIALRLDALLVAGRQANEDWTEHELDAIIPNYFEMLKAEITGERYKKSERRAELLEVIGRSPGAIEFKHQNISAVLDELGKTWILGYKPQAHRQTALAAKVEQYLLEHPAFDEAITPTEPEEPISFDPDDVFEPGPVTAGRARGDAQRQPSGSRARGYNAAERDAVNKKLGRRGEKFVVELERRRLQSEGLHELASKVEWVADTRGDGLGFDILSFNSDGDEIWVEVKTTNGAKETPFYITKWNSR